MTNNLNTLIFDQYFKDFLKTNKTFKNSGDFNATTYYR